jgi:phosphoglycerate dehydrogenase-like enzyme
VNVVYHYATGPAFEQRLASLHETGIVVSSCAEQNEEQFFQLLEDAEILWHCLYPVDERVMAAAPRLRLIQKIGIGVNTIDLDAARRRGICVCNMPGTNSRAVAEHTLGLMLSVLRQIPRFDRDMRDGGGWNWAPARQDHLKELHGARIGLVGFGAIPALLAPLLDAFGAEVAYTARHAGTEAAYEFLQLDDLVARSDILSLHVPLTDETRRLLDRNRLRAMPRGSILINTARGALVDEKALVDALTDGHLAGAGLDAFAVEPLPPAHPFFQLPTVVMTPHIAWLTQQTLSRSLDIAVANCERLRNGEALLYRVV